MMSDTDFSLFDDALKEYENKIEAKLPLFIEDDDYEIKPVSEDDECKHLNTTDENGTINCTDCGIEVEKSIYYQKEWRFYGQSDNKKTSDPNRVHLRKIEERTIYKDVENMGFSDKIVALANQIYIQVTKGQIFRGNSRKAIIFACIFHSFKVNNKAQTHEKLIRF